MNRNFLIGIAVFIIVLFLLGYWLMSGQSAQPSTPLAGTLPSSNGASTTSSNSTPAPTNAATSSPPAVVPFNHQAEVNRERKVWDLFLLTPITFYGKVVDTHGQPVSDAKVLISMDDTAWEGHTRFQKTSDSQGLFSASGHGLGLVAQVSKEGYYSTDTSDGSFTYVKEAGKLSVYNDPNAPAIFVLRKMGKTEPLIKMNLDAQIPKNGMPVRVNLSGGITDGTNESIQVESWTHDEGIPPNGNHPFDWQCKITVLGGGLQPRTGGEFDFIAPENGYQPSDEITMSASNPKWSYLARREYFLQLANGDYARMSFAIGAGGANTFEITSYLNPVPGHRNLEYDPDKQINK